MLSRSMQTSNDHQEINAFALTMEASSLCKDRKFKASPFEIWDDLVADFQFLLRFARNISTVGTIRQIGKKFPSVLVALARFLTTQQLVSSSSDQEKNLLDCERLLFRKNQN